MIRINYRKYTDEEIAKVKELVEGWKPTSSEDQEAKIEEIARAVPNTDHDAAFRLVQMVQPGWKEFGTADLGGKGKDPEINLITYGKAPSKVLGDVAIHEMGHIQSHLKRPDLEDTQDYTGAQFNSFLQELIAFHYALYKQGNRERFNHQVESFRDKYNKYIEHDPSNLEEMFDNKSFDDMMRIADYIATKDLKAKKKMGKPKPYFPAKKKGKSKGATAQASLRGVGR